MKGCPNCGGGVVHLNFGGGKGEWRCLAGCNWTTRNGGKKCVVCGAPDAYLCDYEVGPGKTCDVPLCWRHTYIPDNDKDIDYCPEHRDITRRKAGLPKFTQLESEEVKKLWQSGEGMILNPIEQSPRQRDTGAGWGPNGNVPI